MTKAAERLETAQHDPETAWCKVVDGRYDIDYEAAARIANRDDEWRELLDADRGYDVVKPLSERIDKLYMQLNAAARGDDADFDGDPIQKWNNLVSATATALAYAVAQGRWAVMAHKRLAEAEALLARWVTPEKDGAGASIYEETEAFLEHGGEQLNGD